MLPSEWMPYAEYFYGAEPVQYRDSRPNHDVTVAQWKQDCEDAFNVAWLRHIHRNDHHWQHWVLRNDDGTTVCLPMPLQVIREMVADWLGAGRAITGEWETAAWYANNKDKMSLHPDTRADVESMLITAPSR